MRENLIYNLDKDIILFVIYLNLSFFSQKRVNKF